jgi:hypothetical protein
MVAWKSRNHSSAPKRPPKGLWFPATIVFRRTAELSNCTAMPAPRKSAWLPVIVLFRNWRGPLKGKALFSMPPPTLVVLFPLMVVFVTVAVPLLTRPPPP